MSNTSVIGPRLANKVSIVTGAGSSGPGLGNGKAIAITFARHGARVVLVDNNAAAMAETTALIAAEGGVSVECVADVTRTEDVKRVVDLAVARFGGVDILVNNVGIVELGNVVDATEESWDRVFAVNLRSAFLTMKYAIPHMIAAGGGRIVNISSVAGIRGGVPYCSYQSSKGAMNALTRSVALDFARQGIRCNAVLPGLMDTPMPRAQVSGVYAQDIEGMLRTRAELSPTGAQGSGWDVAGAALFLASDDGNYVNGQELVVDGGLSATHPMPAKQAA